MRRICVYYGFSPGLNPQLWDTVTTFGKLLIHKPEYQDKWVDRS